VLGVADEQVDRLRHMRDPGAHLTGHRKRVGAQYRRKRQPADQAEPLRCHQGRGLGAVQLFNTRLERVCTAE
jgi:hypothetical protein